VPSVPLRVSVVKEPPVCGDALAYWHPMLRWEGGDVHVKELFDLTGKVAIVTGGSRGLGLEIAEGLAEAGARVAITGRRRQYLDPAEEGLRGRGFEVLSIEADVADPAGVRQTIEETVGRFGGLDVLINNAGMGWGAPSLEYPLDKWQQTLDINLTGVWLMSQAAAPRLIERGGGTIVNISSMLGQRGIDPEIQDSVAYHAAKGGVDALTRELAVTWAPHNIRVNAVAPGYFHTRMTQYIYAAAEEKMNALSPFNRTGSPGELKGAVLFLAAPASTFITGQVLAVDGGASAW
jgi:NAD(P)-dependent dehydrogenase (short-subunit alcohol dehydrogenase family)